MGKFSKDKREAVRRNIEAASTALFLRYGIKKTTIDDIARAAGIGKGTFYLFYPTKEDLFFELVRRGYGPRRKFLEELEKADKLDADEFKAAFKAMIKELADNPLLHLLYQSGEADLISHVIMHRGYEEHARDDEDFIHRLLDTLRQKGFSPGRSPETMNGLFHVIWQSLIRRDDISKDSFDEILDILTDTVCNELIGFRANSEDLTRQPIVY